MRHPRPSFPALSTAISVFAMILYVGSYSAEPLHGLRVFQMDEQTGALTALSCVEDAADPIYLALSPDKRFLYVAENVTKTAPDPKKPGGISVYAVQADASLTRLASWALAPTVPCHISLSPDGTKLAWAEYRTAHAGVLTVDTATGMLTPLASVHHTGAHGPNAVRQEAPHAHFASFTPDGTTLLVCDLGMDRVFAYGIDEDCRVLRHIVPSRDFVAPPGSGPRHLAFLPGTDIVYLVCELDSSIHTLKCSPDRAPEMLDSHSLLPPDFTGQTKAAAIRVSPDRRWVLASNRGHDSIAAFRIDPATGCLTPGPISKLDGPFPRDFVFSPDGRFVVATHKLADEFAVYAFDAETGALTLTPHRVTGFPKPLALLFA